MNIIHELNQFVSGAITLGYLVPGLFFLKFWRQSRDRLFALFALAFFILAGQRLVLAFTTQNTEGTVFLYMVRLIAFLLILVAIIDKNRSNRRESDAAGPNAAPLP